MAIGLMTAASLLIGLRPVQSDEVWSAITQSDAVVMGVERSSVQRVGDEVTFLMLNAWNQNPAAAYAVATVKMDCEARTFRIGERRSYDSDGAELGLFTTEGPVTPVEPGSTLTKVAAAVCEDVWPTGYFNAGASLEFYQRSMVVMAQRR